MLLPSRASHPPPPLLRLPWAQTSAVDRIDVVSVVALPKIGCRSSIGIRKLPNVARPQLPCRPTKVSRLANPEDEALLVSAWIFDSIRNVAFSPPPRLSVAPTPKREELLLSRATVGLMVPPGQFVTIVFPCAGPWVAGGTAGVNVPLLPWLSGLAQVAPFTSS